MIQGIYRIRNKLDDKRYVGSINDFEKGWIIRQQALRRGDFYNIHLQRAWNKYGEENFVFEIEEEVEDTNALLSHEQIHLDDGFAKGILYNIARKAGGGDLGEESRAKIRKGHMGIPLSAEHKVTLSKVHTGKKLTTEHKKNISIALTGREVSEETRAKLSKVNMGHEVSEETRYKIGIISAKPYPAFYNIRTGEFIPAGVNLIKMCRERNLNDGPMSSLRRKKIIKTRNDWRIATENEIHKENTIKESIREESAT